MKIIVNHTKGVAIFEISLIPRDKGEYGTGNYVSVFNDNNDYYLDGRYWGKMDSPEKVQQYLTEWAEGHWGNNLINVEFNNEPILVPMPGIEKLQK